MVRWNLYGEKGTQFFEDWRSALTFLDGFLRFAFDKFVYDAKGVVRWQPPAETDFLEILEPHGKTPISRYYGERKGVPFEIFRYHDEEPPGKALFLEMGVPDGRSSSWWNSHLLSVRYSVKDGWRRIKVLGT
jgi:hypothetical protein